MIPLPVDGVVEEVADSLAAQGVVLLHAPPGTGKTTRVPPALVLHRSHHGGAVWVLEPRRIAARAAARRVAAERGWTVGGEVGFQVRGERKSGRDTKVCFVTEGVLVRRLLSDPELSGIGTVVLDEFHERHIEGDLALAMLQEVRDVLRPDLRLVVMSATLDAGPLRAFLPGAATVAASAEVYPVEVIHRPLSRRPEAKEIAGVVVEALAAGEGDVLVFLPGVGEIEAVAGVLRRSAPGDVRVLPLHGRLPAKEQDAALQHDPRGRRVVLSTNLAESSLTVPGVRAVVDTGLARVLRNNPQRGIDALHVERISLASAEQRRGRAGREAPGRCYRLWSQADDRRLAPHDDPDVARIDLAGAALTVHGFAGRDAGAFGWFQPPPPAAWARAERLLRDLGAVDGRTGQLSQLGVELSGIPMHPRLARMVLAGEELGIAEDVHWLAALLDEADFAPSGAQAWTADVAAWAVGTAPGGGRDPHDLNRGGLPRPLAQRVKEAARRLARRKVRQRPAGGAGIDPDVGLARAVLAGWSDRVVQRSSSQKDGGRRGAPSRQGVMVGGRGVTLPESADGAGDLLVAVELLETRPGADRSPVGRFCAVTRDDLEAVFPLDLHERQQAVLQPQRGRVVARHQLCFRDLVMRDTPAGAADPEQAAELLRGLVEEDPWRWLGDVKELRLLLGRVAWLREALPDLGLQEIGPGELADAAVDALAGATDLARLTDKGLVQAVQGRFLSMVPGWQRHAPERLQLPSGRKAVIDYGDPGGPTVGARIQELFGCGETPRIAGGRVPLVLSILGPNHRPVQVTRDLSSFWANLYPGVRRELSRRYPRHSWPEDPLAAAPEARPKRRPKR